MEQLSAIAEYLAVLITRRDLLRSIQSDSESIKTLMNDTPGGFVRLMLTEKRQFVPVYANDSFAQMIGLSHEKTTLCFGDDVLNGVTRTTERSFAPRDEASR